MIYGAAASVARAFLVVTPIGLRALVELAEALSTCGVRVADRQTLEPWSCASTCLYARGNESRALRFETHWRALFPDDRAERWNLADEADYARLLAHKSALRERFHGLPLPDCGPGEPQFQLHAFHVPDPKDVQAEAQRLTAFGSAG